MRRANCSPVDRLMADAMNLSLILYSHWLSNPGWRGKRDYMEKNLSSVSRDPGTAIPGSRLTGPGVRFSKSPETFPACKAIARSRTLRLQSFFIHIFLKRSPSDRKFQAHTLLRF